MKTRSSQRTKLSVRKKLLFSLLAIGLFFGCVELALRVTGIGATPDHGDPFVGFAGYAPLFVETAGADGQAIMKTADGKLKWFNSQSFPRNKPADTRRIFCMGGSTTFGRPYDDRTSFCGWLRAFLQASAANGDWDVINAGGVSYASYRISRLVDEVLTYDPDLLIIYTGHNEFLEERTYSTLKKTSESFGRSIGWLERLRLFTVLRSAMRPKQQPQQPVDADELLPAEVDTILESSIGLEAYHRDEELERRIREEFERHLKYMVQACRDSGVTVILVTPACQLRDCRPFKSEFSSGVSASQQERCLELLGSAEAKRQAGNLPEALNTVSAAVEIDPNYAAGQYLRGTVLWELDRPDDAKAAFIMARDNDVCPLRASSSLIEIVRSVAEAQQVPSVDFVRLVEELAEDGVPGADLFLDHVHPTIEGNRRLALQLLTKLDNLGLIDFPQESNRKTIDRVTANVNEQIDASDRARALVNLAKVLSWAGKYDEADRLAVQAAELNDQDPEALYQAGSAEIRDGHWEKARALLERSLDLQPNSAATLYAIGLTFAEQDRDADAIEYYRRAAGLSPEKFEIRFNWGNSLLAVKDFPAAAQQYRKCTELRPDYVPAYNSLGIALAEQGFLAEAADAFRQAVEIDPAYEDARSNLERALKLLNR